MTSSGRRGFRGVVGMAKRRELLDGTDSETEEAIRLISYLRPYFGQNWVTE